MEDRLVAGVDIGGTKTQVRIARAGSTLAERIVPTDSWRVRDARTDAKALVALVAAVSGGLWTAALAVGSHGCDSDAHCRELAEALEAETASLVQVVNDSELMVPAAGFARGIGVVSGTGSIAVARTADGRMLTAGGWGWILGDEGSASAIVREAARAVRKTIDRDEQGDALIPALMKQLQTDDPTRIGRLLDATRGAAAWGQHANAVFEAATRGSRLAERVICEGGAGLAELVAVLIGRGADASRIVAGGSVIVEQPSLFEAFRLALQPISPSSQVELLREPPVVGAVALAERLLATAAATRDRRATL